MSETKLHDLLVEVAEQAVPTDLLDRVHHRVRVRRRRRGALVSAALVVAAVAVAGSQLHGTGTTHRPPVADLHSSRHVVVQPHGGKPVRPFHAPGIKLVAYTGKQLSGFTVDKIPAGWVLGGVNAFVLTIDPAGDPNTNPAQFVGKLVVSLQANADFPRHGIRVTVNGQEGMINGLGSTKYGPAMTFNDSAGHTIDIETPLALGWTTVAPIVSFAEGIHVSADAMASVG
jgi:hypothetical protein